MEPEAGQIRPPSASRWLLTGGCSLKWEYEIGQIIGEPTLQWLHFMRTDAVYEPVNLHRYHLSRPAHPKLIDIGLISLAFKTWACSAHPPFSAAASPVSEAEYGQIWYVYKMAKINMT